MGQVALGFRSLLIKLAVFFVMAALLAWALGGTLWPRAEVAQLDAVSFDGREWFWQVAVGGGEAGVRWTLMQRRTAKGEALPVDGRTWVEVAGPVAVGDALYYAGRASFHPDEAWSLEAVAYGEHEAATHRLPDRLAVERQLARVKRGLPIQDSVEIRRHRDHIIDPATSVASPGP